MTGSVTKVAGNCTMASTSTMSARKPAPGIPIITKPIPTSSIWMKAMPMTPCATARIVAEHVDRHDEDQERQQHDHGRGAAVLAAEPALEHALKRVEVDRKDYRPDHQGEERAEHLVARNHQSGHHRRTDQRIEQAAKQRP